MCRNGAVLWRVWVVVGAALARSAGATAIHVPADYPTIQGAIDAAAAGDSVLISPGTYVDTEVRTVDWDGSGATWRGNALAFLKDGVALIGEGGAAVTVLDMSQLPVIEGSAVIAGGNLSSPVVVQGLSLRGRGSRHLSRGIFANADGAPIRLTDCAMSEFRMTPFGSPAIGCIATSLTVEGCEFRDCSSIAGGAFTYGGGDLLVHDSRFVRCVDDDVGGGGAIYVVDTLGSFGHSVTIERCVFEGNGAGGGGGFSAFEARPEYTSFTLRECVFQNIRSGGMGGGIYLEVPEIAAFTISGCVFEDCRAIYAGGVSVYGGHGDFVGNTFHACDASQDGAAVWGAGGASIRLERNIITNCGGSAAVVVESSPLTSSCNAFWANANGDVSGFTLSETDRITDPMFCDAANGDLTLQSTSPCLPGSPLGCDLIGALGQGCGTVSLAPTSWARLKGIFR